MPYSSSFVSLDSIHQSLGLLSHDELHRSNNGRWSVLAHLYHCYLVERGVLAYIKLKTQDPTALEDVTLKTRIKFWVFFTLLRIKALKVKAPSVVQDFPEIMDTNDLIQRWTKTRKEANLFFDNLADKEASKGIFKHIFIGRMSKKLTQKFIALHLRHHLRLCELKAY